MATKTIEFSIDGTLSPASAKLVRAESSAAAADPAGHALTTLGEWRFSFTVTENLVGIYRIDILDGDGVQIGVQWVNIEANLAVTYTASNDFNVLKTNRDVTNQAGSILLLLNDLYSNVSTVITQTNAAGIKSGVRAGLNGVWEDEHGNVFTLEVTDP